MTKQGNRRSKREAEEMDNSETGGWIRWQMESYPEMKHQNSTLLITWHLFRGGSGPRSVEFQKVFEHMKLVDCKLNPGFYISGSAGYASIHITYYLRRDICPPSLECEGETLLRALDTPLPPDYVLFSRAALAFALRVSPILV